MKKYFAVLLVLFVIAAVIGAVAQKPQDSYVLKAPMGQVTFPHKAHMSFKCDTCHHASKPEKPNKTAQEACTDCHTVPAQAPMKTANPFHTKGATAGVCIDCHKKEAAAGKKAPTKCMDCHKKA